MNQPNEDRKYQLLALLYAYETGVGHGEQGRGADFKDENWGNPELAFAYRRGVKQGEKALSSQNKTTIQS